MDEVENKCTDVVGEQFLHAHLEHLKVLLFIAIRKKNESFIKSVLDFLLGWNTAI